VLPRYRNRLGRFEALFRPTRGTFQAYVREKVSLARLPGAKALVRLEALGLASSSASQGNGESLTSVQPVEPFGSAAGCLPSPPRGLARVGVACPVYGPLGSAWQRFAVPRLGPGIGPFSPP